MLINCRDATTDGLIKVRDAYPFGVDPVWHGSRSELPFLNSLKMKMSILLGVAQMNLGIILSFFNAKFFRSAVDIWYVEDVSLQLLPICSITDGPGLIFHIDLCLPFSQEKFTYRSIEVFVK